MGATDAVRQRRYRAHRRGDHSLCDPQRDCATPVTPVTVTPVTPAVTSPVDAGPPVGLGLRGERLWRDLVVTKPGPAQRVLIEEACRLADRLERLDRVLRGDGDWWLRLVADEDSGEVTVIIDKAMAEARQSAVALKQIVAELRQSDAVGGPVEKGGGGILDQLAARREARLADAAGS